MNDLPFDIDKPGEIRTLSGHYLDVFDPDPATLDIRDIARGLALRPRYGAQLPEDYSIGEHSCHVHDVVQRLYPKATRAELLASLLHDAPEAYIGDMPKPIKMKLPGYQALETILLGAIFERCHLDVSLLDKGSPIDRIDKQIRYAERFWIYNDPIPEEAPDWAHKVIVRFWSSERAEAEFLGRYAALVGPLPRGY